MAQNYDSIIEGAAKQYNVDPALIRGLIQTESSGNPNAKSEKGAQGLGQLMPATAKGLGVTDPNDPQQNIYGTAKYLDQLLTKSGGNVQQALTWYHGGFDPANYGPRTAAYPGKVIANMQGGTMAKTLPGIPDFNQGSSYSADGTSNDDIFAQFSKAPVAAVAPSAKTADSAQSDDAIFAQFSKAPTTAAPQAQAAPQAGMPASQKEAMFPSMGLGEGVNNFIDAAGHHAGNAVLGAVQLGANALGMGEGINQYVQQREQNYQAAVPNTPAAYAGAAAGEILPFLGTGAATGLRAAADAGGSLAARLGAGAGLQTAGRAAGAVAGNAGLGALAGTVAPVIDGGQNFDQSKLQQVGIGAGIGAVAPVVTKTLGAAGSYAGNLVGSLVRPFTKTGQQTIANNVLRGAAADGPQVINPTEIVPGSSPTLAEATANPGVATLQRVMADRNPNAFTAQQQGNQDARSAVVNAIVGTPADIEAAQAARNIAANAQISQVFQGAQPVNTKPVVDAVDAILNGPSGKRDAVKQVLTNIRSKLVNGPDITTTTPASKIVDAQGNPINPGSSSTAPNLETNAETLYNSVRKQIGDMLDTKMATSNPSGLQASRELLQVRDALDTQLNDAAPGFGQYLSNYAQASQPINAMQHLQGLNLVDAKGNLTLQKVQTAINNITKLQNAAGTNNAKAINPDQLTALKSVRDDLLRKTNTDLGRSAGSNTYQNLATNQLVNAAFPGKLGSLVGGIGDSGAATAGATLGAIVAGAPGAAIGGAVAGGGSKLMAALLKNQNAAIEGKLSNMLQNPVEAQRLLGTQGLATKAADVPVSRLGLLPATTGGLIGLNNSNRTSR